MLENQLLIAFVKRARKGDVAAQAWLYDQFAKDLYNSCLRMIGDRDSAKDIVQEAFILAFSKVGQLKQEQFFGTWLNRIMINQCIRQLKKRIRWKDLDSVDYDTGCSEDSHYLQKVSTEIIHTEIMNLPEGCRQVFNLYVLEDYSHKDIAAQLGVTESTSKSQYHRARTLLKERIQKHIDDGRF